jgi:endonuclease G, mitochondrial
MKHIRFICAIIAVFFCEQAQAANCAMHYAAGKAPQITNKKLRVKTQELCYEAFAVMHSGVTRTPLWSAEHLIRQNIELAQKLSREDSFHPDENLPAANRAELSDYAHSGFNRGHMSPNGDMPTRTAQHQSFSLANMIPQNPNNNSNLWADIEAGVRQLAKSEGELYVISGPAFIGKDLRKIGNVLIPTHVYKVVYSPKQNKAGAYFVANEANQKYKAMSVAELEKTLGIALLPGVSQDVKATTMNLPPPLAYTPGGSEKPKKKTAPKEDGFDFYKFASVLLDLLEKILKLLKH